LFSGQVPKWLKGTDCKSVALRASGVRIPPCPPVLRVKKENDMKLTVYFLAAVMIGLFFTACLFAEPIGQDDSVVQGIATPILNNILEGLKSNDYAKYTKDFDPTAKEAITEEAFKKAVDELKGEIGNYVEKKFMGFLNKGQMTLVVWKAKFDQTQDDILVRLVLTKRGDQYLVTGLWFE
jgi:hypothetical protein